MTSDPPTIEQAIDQLARADRIGALPADEAPAIRMVLGYARVAHMQEKDENR